MKKEEQEALYKSIGRHLTRAREQSKLSTSQLASRVSEQYNTVKAIEDGKPFMAHQLFWMNKILGMNLNILIKDAVNENGITISGDDNDKKETNSLDSFI